MNRFAHAACAILLAQSAPAQIFQDEGLWTMVVAQGAFAHTAEGPSPWRWWLDVHQRFGDEIGLKYQTIVRPAIGYALDSRTILHFGHGLIQTETPAGRFVTEQRSWQQITWSPDIDFFGLTSRTRLEERFVEDRGETGLRLRQFFRLEEPLDAQKRLSVVGWDEVFFDLNATRYGQNVGFNQNRSFLGLAWRPEGWKEARFEIGYLNQYLRRVGDDSMNHVLSVNMFLTF
ncbi:MAG: DUF2490 domain-containing protein [Planctomycetota bacterium]